MILTSTRAVPNGAVDILSDYDIILVLSDVRPFFESRDWLAAFGPVLVLYRDPLVSNQGHLDSGYVIQFENDLKIDFSLWSVEIMQQVAADPRLPDEFDAGYRVLLDKDHLTDTLKPPTYRAYIPTPPTEAKYRESIEIALLDATYVAKFLWRDDMMAAKFMLDNYMKDEHLRPMLEWHYEIDHHWSVKPDLYGRGMKKWLRPDLWTELEGTYSGAGVEETWGALFKTIALYRKVAIEVGNHLGFTYPEEMERRTMAYIQKIKKLEPGAESFSA